MKVITLAAGDSASVAAASQLVAAIRGSALQGFGSELPTSLTSVASSLDLASLAQNPTLQTDAVPLLQAAAAAAGGSWDPVALVRPLVPFLETAVSLGMPPVLFQE